MTGSASNRSGTDPQEQPELLAHGCEDDHFTYPSHPRCPTCGKPQEETVALTSKVATVVTWTRVTSTPPGVREPNTLALVEFALDSGPVRVLGGTTDDVAVGDEVQPVYVGQLRDPAESVRQETAQPWDGFRFERV